MSNGIPHEEARNALEALALDALDASERAAVVAHVDGCAVCRYELTALENVAAQLTYAVRPVPMSDEQRDRVRSRLMSRVSGGRSEAPREVAAVGARAPHHRPTAELEAELDAHGEKPFHILMPKAGSAPVHHDIVRFTAARAWWLAAAASLIAIVSLASLYQVTKERDAVTTAYQIAAVDRSGNRQLLDSLRNDVTTRDRVIANLTGPDVAVMTLASAGPNAPSGRMFWNQSVNAWTFVAHKLPKPAPGRTYQLWLVTAKQKISAGTFMPAESGDAMMQATYALPKNALAAVAVTDEPEAGSRQPTTTPVLVAVASAR
ncbi:MAG: anti-sigma factor [Gemmatimonadota bacterium]|nr:anti-sigma factor [Gemmatimonadota bacterium]